MTISTSDFRKKGLTTTLFLCFFSFSIPLSMGQSNDSLKTVEFMNASFEMNSLNNAVEKLNSSNAVRGQVVQINFSNAGKLPDGWETCNFNGETPPDIQPNLFGVTLKAADGKNYVGMVGRDNGTFESITQKLPAALQAGVCYKLSIYLAKSISYESISRKTGLPANYNRPLKLMIFGNDNDSCTYSDKQFLNESPPINNNTWRKYTFIIKPTTNIVRLHFVANYVIDKAYNGNILMDNLSQIVPVNCDDLTINPLVGLEVARHSTAAITKTLQSEVTNLKFVKKQAILISTHKNTEGVAQNAAFDALLYNLVKYPHYKLTIRVKKNRRLVKKRIAYLYSYAFRNTEIPARRLDFKRYRNEDEFNFWGFENSDVALNYTVMEIE